MDKKRYEVLIKDSEKETLLAVFGTSFSFANNGTLVIYDEGESVAAFPNYVYIIEITNISNPLGV